MIREMLLFVCLTAGIASGQEHFDIFIVSGQSNARAKYAQGVFDAIVDSGRFAHPVLYHRHHGGTRLSHWVDGHSGSYTLEEHFLGDFWDPDGSTDLQTLVNRLSALGHTWDIAGFFWFQGEADSGSETQRRAYLGRFYHMLNALEINAGLDHDIPFVITVIDFNGNVQDLAEIGRTPEDIEAIRQKQFEIGAGVPYGAAFDSRGWPRLDVWHVGDHADPRGIYGPVYDLGRAEAEMLLNLPPRAGRADMNGDNVLDLTDLQLFTTRVRRHDPRADLAAPADVYDLADVQVFAEAFISGG